MDGMNSANARGRALTGNISGTVVVVGAGIAGVSAAIWLQRAGADVVLIDRKPPGEGASFGNAGVLAACSVAPVTGPGLAVRAPFLALDPDFPLFVVWRKLPAIAPWLFRYMLNANEGDTRRIAGALTGIVSDTVQQHRDLARNTGAQRWLEDSSYVFAYGSRRDFENDRHVWSLRHVAGFVPEEIEGEAVRELVPGMAPEIGFLAVMHDHGYVRNPGEYVKDLAKSVQGAGGRIVRADVMDFDLSGGRIRSVGTSEGRFDCTTAIIAAGVWSGPLMRKLDLQIPIQSERGYHILYRNPSIRIPFPIMVSAGKFVATPMDDGLRCAGVIEFGGLQEPPSAAPPALIRKLVAKTFPDLTFDEVEEWSGHRPAPSDSLPLIGEIGKTRVFAAFGHHHIGLTGGPKTGRIVAALAAGTDPGINTAPYAPNRFRQRR